ncbi:RNA polymerase III subunit C82, partial [Ascosphaera pollenicola]
ITDNFGDLYAIIFSYLFNHGRQPIPRIVRGTRLTGKQVRHGLAVLVQQHLVYHTTTLDDGNTYYEANWKNAYYLVRSGRALQLVRERLGEYAMRVMETLLYLGHAKISYLETVEELMVMPPKEGSRKKRKLGNTGDGEDELEVEGIDGDAEGEDDHDSVAPLHPTLQALASHGFILRVRDAHFQSPGDLRDSAEQSLRARSDIRALRGKRQEEAILTGIENLVRERTDGHIKAGVPDLRAEARNRKRKAANAAADTGKGAEEDGVEKARKRLKVEMDDGESDDGNRGSGINDVYGYEDDFDDEAEPLDGNMIIRSNYQKLDVALRTTTLLQYVREKTTEPSSKVYAALLARIETRIPTCRTREEPVPEGEEAEQYSTAVSLQTVIDDLEASGQIDGLGGVFGDPALKATSADDLPSRVRAFQVEQHLSYLAQEPHLFTTRNISSGILSYSVEFRHLARALRHLEIERLVSAQFGSIAVRIIRILTAKGKLDEKRLQEISLISTRDLRIVLGQLEAAGWLELQEVPRDAQRQPARTIYLWFFDADRVTTNLVETSYKSMARLFTRLGVERNKVKGLLEKTERLDVRGNEERYLSQGELEALDAWKKKENLFLGSIGRLDALIAVLRDY